GRLPRRLGRPRREVRVVRTRPRQASSAASGSGPYPTVWAVVRVTRRFERSAERATARNRPGSAVTRADRTETGVLASSWTRLGATGGALGFFVFMTVLRGGLASAERGRLKSRAASSCDARREWTGSSS